MLLVVALAWGVLCVAVLAVLLPALRSGRREDEARSMEIVLRHGDLVIRDGDRPFGSRVPRPRDRADVIDLTLHEG